MADLEVTAMAFSHIHTEEATVPHTINSKVGKSQMMLTCLKSNPIREVTRQPYSARASTGPHFTIRDKLLSGSEIVFVLYTYMYTVIGN